MSALNDELKSEERREILQPYQDLLINGEVQKYGRAKYSEEKAQAIIKILPNSFTFLDLGANLGYISFRIAEARPEGHGFLIEGGPNKFLLQSAIDQNAFPNLKVHYDNITLTTLEEWKPVYDYVLALNFIHWFYEWKRTIEAILKLGKKIIISTPPAEDKLAVGQGHNAKILDYFLKMETKTLLEVPRKHAEGIERMFICSGQ